MTADTPPAKLSPDAGRFRGRLARNLIFILLPLSLIPVLVMGAAAYFQSRTLLFQQATDQLTTFQSEEAEVLGEWEMAKHERFDLVVGRQEITEALEAALTAPADSPEFASARETIVESLNALNADAANIVVNHLLLVNQNGQVMVATDPEWEGIDLSAEAYYREWIQNATHSSFAIHSPAPLYSDKFVVLTTHPLDDQQGGLPATLVGITEPLPIQGILEASLVFLPNAQAFFITQGGDVVEFDRDAGQFVKLRTDEGQNQRLEGLLGETPVLQNTTSFGGQPVVSSINWLPFLNAWLAVDVPQATVYRQINRLAPFNIVLMGLTMTVLGLAITLGARRVVSPLLQVVDVIRGFSEGEWQKRASVSREDEIGLLAFSFNQMADELTTLYQSLRQEVEDRTLQVMTASEVAQLATSAHSLGDLLGRTANLITEHFKEYQAAIFLLDEAKEKAVLREATGIVGRSLKTQGYEVDLDAQAVVSWVARNNQARVVPNTTEEAYPMRHELLPETRSEVAIPLSVGGEVLGVLDVQSPQLAAFGRETVEVFQTLANQLAGIIQSFRLHESAEIDPREITALYQASHQIAKGEDREQIFQAVSEAIQKTSFIGSLYSSEGSEFALVESRGPQPSYAAQLPRSLRITPEEVLEHLPSAAPLILKDTFRTTSAIHPEMLRLPHQLNCQTAAYLPIVHAGRLIGLIILASHEVGAITETSLKPFAGLVELLAVALKRVETLDSAQQRVSSLQTINDFSRAIAVETDLNNLYQLIHTQIAQIMGAVEFYIALYDSQTQHISFPYVYEDNQFTQIDPLPLGEGLTSHIIHTREPLMLVEDAHSKALALGAKVIGKTAKSWLGVPLIVAGEVLGVMSAQDTEKEQRFTEDDLNLFSTLASQIAGVIHSARLLEETKRRALQLQTASEIAREASSTLELDQLLRKAINLVLERFDFYHASVFLLDPPGEFAVVKESTGEAGRRMIADEHKLEVGSQSIIGHVTGSGTPLVVNDVGVDPTHRFNPLLPDTRAELGIPLKVGDRVLGALDVQSTQPFAFSPDDVEVLHTLADQLAVAVANAQLFSETQEHLAQHRLIHHVTSIAASSSSMEDALSSAVQGLRVSLGGRVAILLLDEDKGHLNVAASAGYEEDLVGWQIEVGQGITGWVAQEREPQLVNDVLSDPRYIPSRESVRSELAVPLIYRSELLGVLNVESDEPQAFDQHDQDILATLAGSLSAIIVNTRLSERQRMLFEVTNKIRRSSNMESILQTTAAELGRALKARRARIEIDVRHATPESPPQAVAEDGKEGTDEPISPFGT